MKQITLLFYFLENYRKYVSVLYHKNNIHLKMLRLQHKYNRLALSKNWNHISYQHQRV